MLILLIAQAAAEPAERKSNCCGLVPAPRLTAAGPTSHPAEAAAATVADGGTPPELIAGLPVLTRQQLRALLAEPAAAADGRGRPQPVPNAAAAVGTESPAKRAKVTQLCLCNRRLSDEPMVECDGCFVWYHGRCVGARRRPSKLACYRR